MVAQPFDEQELKNIDLYLGAGLMGIAICRHGIARSWSYADYMTRCGMPTVFWEGGFESFEKMNQWQRKDVLNKIREIPVRYAVLQAKEVRRFFDYITKIEATIVRDEDC